MASVLRIYLDQNKWVDLARALTGHRLGVPFVEALSEARAAVASGRASFPLDMYSYVASGRRRDDRSRNDVADVTFDLSRQDAVARAHEVLPAEIDAALQRRFNHPTSPRQLTVYEPGLSPGTIEAFSPPEFDLSRLHGGSASERPGAVAFAQRTYERLFKEGMLARAVLAKATQAPRRSSLLTRSHPGRLDHQMTEVSVEAYRRAS